MKTVKAGGVVLRISLFCFVLPFVSSLIFAAVLIGGSLSASVLLPVTPAVMLAVYFVGRKKLIPSVAWVNGVILAVLITVLSLTMWISDGALVGMTSLTGFASMPLYLGVLILLLMDGHAAAYIVVILSALTAFLASVFLQPETRRRGAKILRFAAVLGILLLLMGGMDIYKYRRRPEVRYAGHGFTYMHGWSSTDFTDYTVYSENSKLVTLDHPASFTIENPDEMPVMDGAEACYPLYAAMAKAVYQDIDAIEKEYVTEGDGRESGSGAWKNGRIVCFTNTIEAFDRLIRPAYKRIDRVDLFFGARPSEGQLKEAAGYGEELQITPIGREAFVFFVEPDNPVTDLSADDVRKIYSGEITNWKELGGKDQKIVAFQRPEDSGSQTMMKYFMGDVPLKAAKTYETVGSMEGVITHVAEYVNEKGAIGYSFRYFVEELNRENNVRMLSIEGIAPTLENIENGSYPLTADLCLITRADDENPNVRKMIDWCLSEEGQEIVKKTGYAGVSPSGR